MAVWISSTNYTNYWPRGLFSLFINRPINSVTCLSTPNVHEMICECYFLNLCFKVGPLYTIAVQHIPLHLPSFILRWMETKNVFSLQPEWQPHAIRGKPCLVNVVGVVRENELQGLSPGCHLATGSLTGWAQTWRFAPVCSVLPKEIASSHTPRGQPDSNASRPVWSATVCWLLRSANVIF